MLFTAEFERHLVRTLVIGGRPAWVAREIGAVLGYSRAGQRLASKITGDWSKDFVAGHDFALLVGADLAAARAACPGLPPSPRGVLLLFESGLDIAVVKSHLPLARELRRFLVGEVLPAVAEATKSAPDLDAATRALRADVDDRRLRSRALQNTADTLVDLGRLDEGRWALCLVRACEIALGEPVPVLYSALDRDWTDLDAVAQRLELPVRRVLNAARSLDLLQRPLYARPQPIPDGLGWTLGFRFSPEAVALIEAWLAERAEMPRIAPTPTA